MKYHKLYVGSRKSFELKEEKKLLFCRVSKKHTANPCFAVCFILAHGKLLTLSCAKSIDFPCAKKTHGKAWICRLFFLNRVFLSWHTANLLFAVCPIESTRQIMKHTDEFFGSDYKQRAAIVPQTFLSKFGHQMHQKLSWLSQQKHI